MMMISTWVAFLCSLISLLIVVYSIGYQVSDSQKEIFFNTFAYIEFLFILVIGLRIVYGFRDLLKSESRLEWISFSLLILTRLFVINDVSFIPIDFALKFRIVALVLLFVSIVELSRDTLFILSKRVNPLSIFVVSFLGLVVLGTLLLLLPNSTYHGVDFVDALFISTSAVCVTGLTSVPVVETFTINGQLIILFLIQIGGLGVITITSFFAISFLEGVSINSQFILKDILSGNRNTNLVALLTRIIFVTFSIEIIGAIAIYYYTSPYLLMNMWDKIFFSVFHSVSAFCNAGFSTLPNNLADPTVVNIGELYIIISLLVMSGGIGFPIFSNLLNVTGHKLIQLYRRLRGKVTIRYVREWDMNSIIVFRTTAFLWIAGALYFLIFEYNGALANFSGLDKYIQAVFNSVTPRTAGFNSFDFSGASITALYVVMFLMWIGGSPQSTAGGIKVTTFAIMFRNITHMMKGKSRVELYGREVSPLSVNRAFATVSVSLLLILVSHITLISIEDSFTPMELLFEIVSAIGTVGLSMGITADLMPESKLIITFLMFVGRIGVITIFASLYRRGSELRYRYPQADVLIN